VPRCTALPPLAAISHVLRSLTLHRACAFLPAIQGYFSQFGNITDVVVMTEGSQRRPRGFGFVTFDNAASVAMITRSRYHPIEGRLVEVKAAVPRDMMPHTAPAGVNAAADHAVRHQHAVHGRGRAPPNLPVDQEASAAIPTGMGQEWYGSMPAGYNGGMMMAGAMSEVTTGVPVYNGFPPAYPPQMMVPMGGPMSQKPMSPSYVAPPGPMNPMLGAHPAIFPQAMHAGAPPGAVPPYAAYNQTPAVPYFGQVPMMDPSQMGWGLSPAWAPTAAMARQMPTRGDGPPARVPAPAPTPAPAPAPSPSPAPTLADEAAKDAD